MAAFRRRRFLIRAVGCLFGIGLLVAGCGGVIALGLLGGKGGPTTNGHPPTTVAGKPTVPAEPESPATSSGEQPKPPKSEPTKPSTPTATNPTVTLTPPPGGIVLAYSPGVVQTATDDRDLRAKWVLEGKVKVLTEPTSVEVLAREAKTCKVKLDGKEWYVFSTYVPAK